MIMLSPFITSAINSNKPSFKTRHESHGHLRSTLLALMTSGAILPVVAAAATGDISSAAAINNTLASPSKQTIEQQQAWQESLQQQRIDALRQSQQSGNDQDADASANTKPSQADPNMVACLPIQQITLGDMPQLTQSVQAKLRQQARQLSVDNKEMTANPQTNSQTTASSSNPQTGQCVSVSDANDLVRAITEAYLDAGYFKINIVPTPAENGRSVWQVSVAKITEIDNQTKLPTQRLFGDIIGKPANMAALDQAVSHGERVIDGQLLLDIYPVGQDVRIKVSQQGDVDPFSADMQWRYDPDDSYGHNLIQLHGTLRNVLGQADYTSISMEQSLGDNYGYDEDNQRRSASIYTLIPNGRWQWSALFAADEYKRTTQLPNSVLEQEGDSWQANIRGDYMFKRDQDSITTLYGQVAHQEVTSELLGSRLDIQSPTLSSGRLGISHTKLFDKRSSTDPSKITTGAWVVDLSAEQGFGNHDNPATEQGLKDEYLRWLLSGYLTHQHPIIESGQSKGYWQMTHELQAQYSDDQLFGVSQQSLGSIYSGVRGIDNAYNAAESGISLRNTLSYEPSQADWKSFGSQKIRWSPYVGVDYGVVKYSDHRLDDDTSDAVSGTVGLKLTAYDAQDISYDRRWQLDVSASRAHTDYANQEDDGSQDTEISAAWQWFF
ncbi:ShlB/FhaC/HecB family hemolysin secretion/activation protein [Psychrobacter sanguinis]|uniref:Haemolysin activator HlyB C-terminal domain-containing protein n=1 Tax=Psychrobacter sanguinis TaxID=861445 RepID=A0A844M1R5_9GAMM|nr:ShlB/FhaC/HecB family hemolysin secretion/activation protein [Psychrobacter sanguinis]MUG32743.1 hypothetical protein [Psychrobacter sanguinis]